MAFIKPNPVGSVENLRERVERLFRKPTRQRTTLGQGSFDLPRGVGWREIDYPSKSISSFLDFTVDAVPDGDVYVFGGVLRDLALLGRKGFDSDIDLVVEGNWLAYVAYLESLRAHKNKFGGYRLEVGGWPVDIWNARETWAIKEGLVQYKGIGSLTKTTVLNWDGILMNWRTRSFIYRDRYFEEIRGRILDIVLEENPNPLGMAVRVFRHLCSKDARKITGSAARYLSHCTTRYSFEQLKISELKSYGNSIIERPVYEFFEKISVAAGEDIEQKYGIASDIMTRNLEVG